MAFQVDLFHLEPETLREKEAQGRRLFDLVLAILHATVRAVVVAGVGAVAVEVVVVVAVLAMVADVSSGDGVNIGLP